MAMKRRTPTRSTGSKKYKVIVTSTTSTGSLDAPTAKAVKSEMMKEARKRGLKNVNVRITSAK